MFFCSCHALFVCARAHTPVYVCVCVCVNIYLGLVVPLDVCGREPMPVGLGICKEDQLSVAANPAEELSI